MLAYIRPGSLGPAILPGKVDIALPGGGGGGGYFGLCSLGGNNGLDLAGLPLLCGLYHFEPRLDLLKNF